MQLNEVKDYRWCGYGEAVGGGKTAREGVRWLLEVVRGSAVGWNASQERVRGSVWQDAEVGPTSATKSKGA